MKIAIVAPPWVPVPPPAYGGTEAVLDTLARGLQHAGHDILLYATGDSTCEVPGAFTFDEAQGTVSTGAASELCHVVEAYERLLDWEPDVMHDHTLVGPVYSGRFGMPIVTTNHGPFDGELGPLYRVIARTVPLIAISITRRTLRSTRGSPTRSTTGSTWTCTRPVRARAATPCSSGG